MKQKKTFLINTVILTLTALILRAAGLFFRVYLSNIIGAEGIGLYQLIFSVYMFASTFATSGISTAVTRLCADEIVCANKKTILKTLKSAIKISVIIGAITNILVYFSSPTIAGVLIGDIRANASIKILSFSLIPMGISACFKGYFMAFRKTIQPSVASIFEQTVRITVVMLLLKLANAKTIESACFYVLLADTIAEISSCVYIYFCFINSKKTIKTAEKQTNFLHWGTKSILKIATPIATGRYLTSGLRTAENLIVPKCLSMFTNDTSSGIKIFGLLKGMALPIIFFPSSFLQAVSTLLIPEISESAAIGETKTIRKDVERVVGITIVGAVLVGGCFYLCGDSISLALYKETRVGELLKILSPLIPLMYLESVVDGILKGLNKQNYTLLYNTIDSSLRILLILFLVPRFGMQGFLVMMVFSNLLTCSLNFIKLLKVTVLKFDIKNWVIKPLISIIISVATANKICFNITNNTAHIIIGITIISSIYFTLILISKTLDLRAVLPQKKSS
ncbi:MAG: oligosaccharide flippase family protein [Clostridia bacterium]|nr:oligosaccharide flippase family protein [Clostridia bacterium]